MAKRVEALMSGGIELPDEVVEYLRMKLPTYYLVEPQMFEALTAVHDVQDLLKDIPDRFREWLTTQGLRGVRYILIDTEGLEGQAARELV